MRAVMLSIIIILDALYVVPKLAGLSLLAVVTMIGVRIKTSFVASADRRLTGAT